MRRILSLLMLLIATSGLWAQVQLKGRVFDSKTNQPLQGAHVRVEGTFLSTISASDGSFSFDKIKNGKYQLTISFIGYSTEKHTVVVPQDKPEQIAMSTNAIMADEVVVAATRLSNQMPTAVKSISKHEITDLNQ
nr:carboxypeptidase-like regulatory domain-containing protein [Bacteroidales bacterium]